MPNKPLSHGRKSISAFDKPQELITNSPRLKDVWKADVVTLYLYAFPGVLSESLIGSSLKKTKCTPDNIN